jgi:hypothetical protein
MNSAFGFAGLIFLGLVSHASAEIVTVTYTGAVVSDDDRSGRFGPSGGINNLVGDTYQVVYIFDTAVGQTFTSPNENYARGGNIYPATNPLLSATATINGINVSVVGSYNSMIFGANQGPPFTVFSAQAHVATDASGGTTNSFDNEISNDAGTLRASITTPFTYQVAPNDYNIGKLYFNTTNFNNGQLLDYTVVNARILTVTETVTPVPATWPMTVIGFIGLGIAAYRKKKNAQPGVA